MGDIQPAQVAAGVALGWAFDASGNAPALEASYSRHSVVLWSGTTFYGRPPVRVKVLVEAEEAKEFSVRVYDVNNSAVIAEATGLMGVAFVMAVYTLAPIANATAAEAVWEVQLKRPSGGSPAVKLNALLGFVQVEFE